MSMKKKFVASGLAAGLVAGAGAGLILQSSGFAGASNGTSAVSAAATTDTTDTGTSDTGTSDTGTSDTSASTDPGADRTARLTEVLQPLVDAGTITADQLQAVVDALVAAGPMGGGQGGPGGDHGGRGGRGPGLDAAATALGITTDELRTQLEAGSTLADVAAAQGVDVQTVIDALVADVKAHLDEEVTEGDLTQAEADTKLADATTRITDGVTNGFPQRGDGDHDGDRPAPGDAPADAPASSSTGA